MNAFAPPEGLSAENASRRQAVLDLLSQRGTLRESNVHLVNELAMALDDIQAARQAIHETGVLTPGYRGVLVKSPAFSVIRSSQATVVSISRLLGIAPVQVPPFEGEADADAEEFDANAE
jgi:hypothetical protein